MSLRERHLEFGADFQLSSAGLFLPPPTVPPARPVAADLFSGAGGFSLGFHQAGFHVAAAADGWATAACTYICNLGSPETAVHLVGDELPDGRKREKAWFAEHAGETVSATELFEVCGVLASTDGHEAKGSRALSLPGAGWIANQDDEPACEHYYLGDIRSLSGQRIVADVGCELAAIMGGPPCQGFSGAGKREVMDPRNSLVFDFMRIVCEANPQTFVMENVPGIVSMVTPEGVPVIDAIARIAEDGGFGTYEAIRRSLMSHPDARAAMRSKPVGRHKDPEGRGARGMPLDGRDRFDAEPAEPDQLTMEMA